MAKSRESGRAFSAEKRSGGAMANRRPASERNFSPEFLDHSSETQAARRRGANTAWFDGKDYRSTRAALKKIDKDFTAADIASFFTGADLRNISEDEKQKLLAAAKVLNPDATMGEAVALFARRNTENLPNGLYKALRANFLLRKENKPKAFIEAMAILENQISGAPTQRVENVDMPAPVFWDDDDGDSNGKA